VVPQRAIEDIVSHVSLHQIPVPLSVKHDSKAEEEKKAGGAEDNGAVSCDDDGEVANSSEEYSDSSSEEDDDTPDDSENPDAGAEDASVAVEEIQEENQDSLEAKKGELSESFAVSPGNAMKKRRQAEENAEVSLDQIMVEVAETSMPATVSGRKKKDIEAQASEAEPSKDLH